MLCALISDSFQFETTPSCRIVFEGDSTVTGLSSQGSPGTSFPSQVMAQFTNASWWNLAAGGNSVDMMLAQTSATIALNPDKVVFWGGVNDLLGVNNPNGPDTAVNVYAQITQWMNIIRAGLPNVQICILTLPPMTTTANGPTQTALNSEVTDLTNLIIGNSAGADSVIDVSNDPSLAPGGAGRTVDGIHYTGISGNTTISNYVLPEIQGFCS